MRDIAFGQYYPASSPIHKMDPRTKLFAAIVFIVAIFLCESFYSYAVCYGFLLVVILVSRVPILSILKTIKAIIFVVILTVIINLFFYKEGEVIFSWWVISITIDGIYYSIKTALRIIFLVMATSMVTFTTTPMSLTDGMESLMAPLKVIKIPVHDIALIMSIALRFIPTLMEEVDKIILAQKARGAHFDNGGLLKRAKAMLPIIVPLFVSTFRRADELAMALDSRCYNATPKRTKMKALKFKLVDLFGLIAVLAFLAVMILFKVGVFGTFPI